MEIWYGPVPTYMRYALSSKGAREPVPISMTSALGEDLPKGGANVSSELPPCMADHLLMGITPTMITLGIRGSHEVASLEPSLSDPNLRGFWGATEGLP